MEDPILSSPDPLNDSPTYYSPKKTQRATKSRLSLPLDSSPTKQRFELDVGYDLSPQKLIVTVEAESQQHSRLSSPSRQPLKMRERTTTTTIPLKGLSDSEQEADGATTPKKRRGRPRKSIGTPIPSEKKGRASTPSRRSSSKRRSIGDLVDGDDENDLDFQIGRNVDMGRRRAKSRSRSVKGGSRRSLSVSQEEEDVQEAMATASIGRGRPRRASADSGDIEPQEDVSARDMPADFVSGIQGHVENTIELEPALASHQLEADDGFIPAPETLDEEYVEEGDDLGEMREFDTILESEEFSMISVDSVPSLRQHFSSPLDNDSGPSNTRKGKSPAIQRRLATPNDSFSVISERILEAATPGRLHLGTNVSSATRPTQTPGYQNHSRKSHLSNFQTANSILDDSFSSVAPEILEAATPGRQLSRPHFSGGQQSEVGIDDSQTYPRSQRADLSNSAVGAGRRSVSATQSVTARLPTPDETPSPGEDMGQGSKALDSLKANVSYRESHDMSSHEVSRSYLKSSPPNASRRYPTLAETWKRNHLAPSAAQTPSIVFSSPSLPPPINLEREAGLIKSAPEYDTRPALSPVARVGQALQNITVPSSHHTGSDGLGSPFKSPVSERKSSSFLQAGMSSPTRESVRVSPQLSLAENKSLAISHEHSLERLNSRQEDPFSSKRTIQQRSPSSKEDVKPYKLELPQKGRLIDSRISSIKSADVSVLSDDAMSWQHEEEISVPEKDLENSRPEVSLTLEQKWAQERAAVSQKIATADPKEVIVIESDRENTLSDDDEDGLGLLVETINSSSPAPASPEQAAEAFEKPRRSKIPSPWRQNSKKLRYSDEGRASSLNTTSTKSIPSEDMRGSDHHRSVTVRRVQTTSIMSDEFEAVDISSVQIPQKSNFQLRPKPSGKLDLSALLSPIKPLPVMPKEMVTQPESSTSTKSKDKEVSSVGPKDKESEESLPFAPIPQKMGFNPSPRKTQATQQLPSRNLFGQSSNDRQLTPSAEESSTSASLERSPLLSKQPQAINRQRQPQQQFSPLPSDESATFSPASYGDKENTPARQDARTLKWAQSLHLATKITQTPLPDRNASPTKSCFRTPALNTNQSPSKNVVFVSSSPVPSPSQETILSPTQWSKAHWLLLEEILAGHKADFERESSPASADDGGKPRRRNSTRVISKLLGKKVTSQGEEMRFEQWHLEAVDEFRGRVPGWEEKVIAMRVFALILGAERRRLGMVA